MHIQTKIAEQQGGIIEHANVAKCPHCNQKLSEFVIVSGKCRQRTMCRRCGYIIDVIVSEMKL